MKRCPSCRRDYYDDTLGFCLDDGTPLVYGVSSEMNLGQPTEMFPTISDELPGELFGRFPTTPTAHRKSRRKLAAVLTGMIAVITAAAFLGYRYFAPAGGDRIRSMAVMPLRPLNDDENAKALGLGLTDALITKLGSLRQVVIRPTSAITAFAPANESVDVGRLLSVDAVLEGTIQEADGRLRVNARLIRTSTG